MYEDYQSSYVTLLEKAKLPTFHVKRMRILAVETFKILNKLAPPVLTDLLVKRESSYNFKYTNIQLPHVKTTKFGKNSFRYAAQVQWNSFHEYFRNNINFNQFKSFMSRWTGKDCNCTACKK